MSQTQRFLCMILLMTFAASILFGQEQPAKPKAPPPPAAISPPGEAAQAPPKESVLPAAPMAPRPQAILKVTNRATVVPSSLGAPQNDKTWCDVYILEDSPKDVLIFDKSGEMIQDARQVYIWFQIATNAPVAKIYRWPGLYRPATVQEENWDVRRLRVVDLQHFQQMAEDGRAAQ